MATELKGRAFISAAFVGNKHKELEPCPILLKINDKIIDFYDPMYYNGFL